jgi:hypothetical protein
VYPTAPEDISLLVFLKFHKVAGSTLASLLTGLTKEHSQTNMWNCGSRFTHLVVDQYAMHKSRQDYFDHCLAPEQKPQCDRGDCKLITVRHCSGREHHICRRDTRLTTTAVLFVHLLCCALP